MERTTVAYEQGIRFCAATAGGRVVCDPDAGQYGPSAPELLMAALGSCIGSVIVYFAERRGYKYEGLQVDMDWEIVENPHRIGRINVHVTMPGPLTDEERAIFTRVADTCLIHNTLSHPPTMSLDLAVAEK